MRKWHIAAIFYEWQQRVIVIIFSFEGRFGHIKSGRKKELIPDTCSKRPELSQPASEAIFYFEIQRFSL